MNRCLPLAFITALLLSVSPLRALTISGKVVDDTGAPLRGVPVALHQVSLDDCCRDWGTTSSSSGSFEFDVPAAVYVIQPEAPTPFYPHLVRVDARQGSQSGIRVQLTREPRRYVPDDPPRAAKISLSTPDERGQLRVSGIAGAVAPNSFVVLVNTHTGDAAFTEAGSAGEFEAKVFAPPGTSILVKTDPFGNTMRSVAGQAFQGMQSHSAQRHAAGVVPKDIIFGPIGPMAPLPGTYIDVPFPPAEGGRIAIGGGGGPSPGGRAGLPSWIVRGSMNKNRFDPGETLELTATISISSSLLSTIEKIGANPLLWFERLTFADGRPAHSHGVQVSSLLTPTGLGIMHKMGPGACARCTASTRFDIPRVASDRAEVEFTMQFKWPADMPSGYYRGLLLFNFSGYPSETPPSRPQLLLDSSNREGPNVMSLPPIRVGVPAPPRLYWTLLTDALTEGTRGAMPIDDGTCCAITAIVQAPSKHLVVPRVDERTQTPLVYRLEPFALTVSAGDRGMTPPPPALRFRFPSGRLTARIERPDGGIETIGPAPFVQARVAGPLDHHGRVPDPGGLSLHDAYQLTTLDPRFEVTFPADGSYRITLDGEVEDLAGTKWIGRGTYEIRVGGTLVLDTATLPGTPFEAGDTFTTSVTVVPPLPAQIVVRTQLYRGEVKVLDRDDRFTASRFGVAVGPSVPLIAPGEYRVDIDASYRDAAGRWWFGSRTWGGVVATPSTPIITHGKRGIDDLPPEQRRAWFFRRDTTSKLGSGHVHLPFHSGDVTWNQESDALIPKVTFDDRQGSVFGLLRQRRMLVEEDAAIGEAPFVLAAPDGNDPHFDPSALDLWDYAYRSIQRPAVRVREQIAPAQAGPSMYWRFSDEYGQQSGNGRNGDRPNDFKFQFAATVIRGPAVPQPHYSIYGSLFVLVPDNDPGGGTRTFPPFQGNGGGPAGPLFALKGKEIDIFFHPTGLRPGMILELGQRVSLAGYSAPTLPSKLEVILTSPSGEQRTIPGQANAIGYFNDDHDFVVDRPGLWSAKVKIWFDGVVPSTSLPVTSPYPTGGVLGSREGEFSFYVVGRADAPLAIASLPTFVRPADGPITFNVVPPMGLSDLRLHYTTTMPGFVLEDGSSNTLSYTYDAPRLARDFPNLDLYDGDGFAGVDTITISLFLIGIDAAGVRKHFARQIVLQGEQLLVTEQKPVPPQPRRRSVRP